jgi:predicted nucleic acid-binding protein
VIVVDTNILVHLWTDTAETPLVHDLLETDAEWRAPILWRWEFRNAVALFMRHRSLPVAAAKRMVQSAEELMAGRDFIVDSSDVIDLVAHSSCFAYDCEFVALARKLGVPLITTDRKIVREFPRIARLLTPSRAG